MTLRKSKRVTMAHYNGLLRKLEEAILYSPSEIIRMRAGMFRLINERKRKR